MFLVSGVEIVSVHDFEGGNFFLFPSQLLRKKVREHLSVTVRPLVSEEGEKGVQEPFSC